MHNQSRYETAAADDRISPLIWFGRGGICCESFPASTAQGRDDGDFFHQRVQLAGIVHETLPANGSFSSLNAPFSFVNASSCKSRSPGKKINPWAIVVSLAKTSSSIF